MIIPKISYLDWKINVPETNIKQKLTYNYVNKTKSWQKLVLNMYVSFRYGESTKTTNFYIRFCVGLMKSETDFFKVIET